MKLPIAICIALATLDLTAYQDTRPWQDRQPWWMQSGHTIIRPTLTITDRGVIWGVGQPYHCYWLQKSTNLETWTDVVSTFSCGTGNFAFCPSSPAGFVAYRVRMDLQPWD